MENGSNGQHNSVVTIHNRYGNPIEFRRLSENEFIMSGGQWIRFGAENEEDRLANKYTFVDPSGGPYISEGMTMGYVHHQWVSKIVRHCGHAKNDKRFDNDLYKENDILIVTYPEKIIRAIVNRESVFRIYSESGNIIESLPNFNEAVKWIEDKYNERR